MVIANKAVAEPRIARKGDPALGDARFGAKAAGLAALDGRWTPEFFALETGAHLRLARDHDLRNATNAALTALGTCADGVVVRSSAHGETLDKRGAFDSRRAEATATTVATCILTMAADAPEAARERLGFVVQQWIGGVATGHLSNERRVSREARGWLCEADLPLEGEDKSFRFRVDSRASGREDLSCGTWEELAAAIRTVAREMHRLGGRYHLEWVWDGARVWIVQCDAEHVERGKPPGSAWNVDGGAPLGSLKRFKRVAEKKSPFPKVEHVRQFRACGLPHGDVRVLAGALLIGRLARGEISDALRGDLSALIEAPVVVRTDFRASAERPQVLSKRTDTCLTYSQLETFLLKTAKTVLDRCCPPSDLAFIAHRFMLARSGAMSFGRVGSSRVRIDATWGIPDSLLFYPHDSFAVDVDTAHVERYLRCKSDYIDVAVDGGWRARSAGSDWDWRPSLSDAEAIRIAEMTVRLTEHVGADIEAMFFIGDAQRGGEHILPWFFGANEREVTEVQAAPGFYVGERVTITNHADLHALDVELSTSDESRRLIICLRPTIDLLRSRDFILEVADVAKRKKLPIELEGSQLSHAYYLLEDAGAAIRCRDPWHQPDRRRSFGKLVRDFVPVKIERRGELATTYSANRTELRDLVKAKVIEEAFEYYWSTNRDLDIEELADLFELLRTAARVQGVNFSVVERAAAAKLKERGGFEHGVVLVETRGSDLGARHLPNVPAGAATRRRASSARRVIRLPGGRLVLPVAPPTGWGMGRPQTLRLTAESQVTVSYGSAEIMVHLEPRSTDPHRDQLRLFPQPGEEAS
jgi:predicted house-cleaning noncanonical NTP pyrophosphatase (MazG superfamily)